MPNSQKGLASILIILLLAFLWLFVYLVYKNSGNFITPSPLKEKSISNSGLRNIYRNKERSYQFSYPEEIEIGSDMGMSFDADSIYLISRKERLPYFGVQSITKEDLQKYKNSLGSATSAYDLIKRKFNKSITNKHTYIRTIEPINEILFAGKKAYKYKMEETGVSTIYGESIKDKSIYSFITLEHKNAYILIISANLPLYDQILSTFKFSE